MQSKLKRNRGKESHWTCKFQKTHTYKYFTYKYSPCNRVKIQRYSPRARNEQTWFRTHFYWTPKPCSFCYMGTRNQEGETERATITLPQKPNVKNVKLELKSPSHPFMRGVGRWSGQVGGLRPRADRISYGWLPEWVRESDGQLRH